MATISVVQFISDKRREFNIKKAERFIKQLRKKSDLVIFPEQFIGGEFSKSELDQILSKFKKMAKKYKIDIVPGSFLNKRGRRTYNTSYYIDSKGHLLSEYNKSAPWKTEKISKGSGPKPFKTRFGNTALIICWDLANPGIASKLSRSKPDLIICPSMWWEGKEMNMKKKFAGDFIDSLCTARAYECRAVLAYANSGGVIRTSTTFDLSAGRSQITMPFYGSVARAADREEQVISSNVDFKLLKTARKYFG